MKAQDFTNFKKNKWVGISGGITANSVFYEGASNRDPFTYFVNSNLNINIKGVYNIPLSFSYSNQEFETNRPISFNRLSIHPSYKWVATHIGDVSVSFSPYTLSGHQFTGIGVDLTPPDKPFKISAMYGRLLKESEFSLEDENSLPVYNRTGFGVKAAYQFKKFDLALIAFKASDDPQSINNSFPIELGISPKANIVGSLEVNTTILQKATVHVEFASSVITEDVNADGKSVDQSPLNVFVKNNATTTSYKAFNVSLNYPVAQGSVGVGYERIDPNYRTLGAYFFNNDFENITANASQSIFDGKVNITANVGIQKDDLDNKKASQFQRIVNSYNINYSPNAKLNLGASYSNFRSFTNIKNQFDEINQLSLSDNIDTLDFQQVSQSANLDMGYVLKKTKEVSKNINVNVSTQLSENSQNGDSAAGGASSFYNVSSGYNVNYPNKNLGITGTLNASLNLFDAEESITIGPSVNLNKQLFDKKVRTSVALSYNQNRVNNEKQNEVVNMRLNGGYVYNKVHNLSVNVLTQYRTSQLASSATDFTVTFAYSYSFKDFDFKKKKKSSDKKANQGSRAALQIVFRDQEFKGSKKQIVQQLTNLQNHVDFKNTPLVKKRELTVLRQILSEQKQNEIFKEKALEFLSALYDYKDFEKNYESLILSSFKNIVIQMGDLDIAFEEEYIKVSLDKINHRLNGKKASEINISDQNDYKAYLKLSKNEASQKEKLQSHRWMLAVFKSYLNNEATQAHQKMLDEFKRREKNKIYRIKNNSPNQEKLESYIFQQVLLFYKQKAKSELKGKPIELKYIDNTN